MFDWGVLLQEEIEGWSIIGSGGFNIESKKIAQVHMITPSSRPLVPIISGEDKHIGENFLSSETMSL